MFRSMTIIRSQFRLTVTKWQKTCLAERASLACRGHLHKGSHSIKNIHTLRNTVLPNLSWTSNPKDQYPATCILKIGTPSISYQKDSRHGARDRLYCTGGVSNDELKKAVQQLTDQFMEAKELMQDARESMGTVYFSEDMEEAQQAVKDTLEQYQTILSKLSEKQRQEILRAIGLKMEELKAQERALKESLHDDH